MTGALALLGGEPTLRPEALPRAWPYWSRRPAPDLDAPFKAWPSPAISEIEDWVAREHGVEHAVYTSSGTSALWAAYFALGLDPGDEVLAPANTFLATVTPLFQLNLVPVLCDSEPGTGNLDLVDAERRLTPRTRAIAVTHLWGTPLDLDGLYRWAAGHGLAVVEDCSHAHGAHVRGRPVGSGATVAALSLGAAKTVSGGVGGALLTRDNGAYERALLLGLPAARCRHEVTSPHLEGLAATGLGANLRGHPLAAALTTDHARRFEDLLAVKNGNLLRLERLLADHDLLDAPARPEYWTRGTRYGVKATRSTGCDLSTATLVTALAAEGVPVSAAPGPLLHRRRLFRDPSAITTYAPGRPVADLAVDPATFPVCDDLQDRMVSFDATLLHGEATALLDGVETALAKLSEQRDGLRRWEREHAA